MRSIKLNRKAISPVLAVLMMIAVAIAGSLIVYAWVTGYIGFTTEKAGQAIMVHSMAYDNDTQTLLVYVQNVGEGAVELPATSCLYLNEVLMTNCTIIPGEVLPEKETATLSVVRPVSVGEKITAKVTTTLGVFTEKSDYPSTGGVPPIIITPPPTVTRVQAAVGSFGSPTTAGNLLVVIAGHRSNFPGTNHDPTIPDWTLEEVAYFQTGTENDDRRIVALFTKIATGSETGVTVTWGDGSSSIFELYQEFTGAASYTPVGSGANSEGHRVSIWATSPMDIPSSALSDPGGENILSIGAAVWRDGGNDISTVTFTGLLDGDVSALGSSCPGASAFSYGSAVTQTSVSWNGANTQDMVSGLLIQFACSS